MATILVVEDNKHVRESICQILADTHILLQAGNGADGFSLYETFHPDLIITDLSMPIMTGSELIQKVRKLDRNVKIVVISAQLQDQTEQDLILKAGANACLRKPIVAKKLIQIVNKLLKV